MIILTKKFQKKIDINFARSFIFILYAYKNWIFLGFVRPYKKESIRSFIRG